MAPVARQSMTAAQRYESLSADREPFLMRAREAARLTIPGLMPPLGATGATALWTPYQSLGARGTNNLASKLLLALFPPGGSFFRLNIDDYVLAQLEAKAQSMGETMEDARAEFDEALAKVERAVTGKMEQKGTRTALFETFKQLIVCGNALLQVLKDGRLKLHRLDSYVVKRDHEGDVLEIVIKETLSRMSVSDEVLAIVERHDGEEGTQNDSQAANSIDIYTRISRKGNKWVVSQEVCGETVESASGQYPLEKTAFLPLRWSSIPGQDYGRGFAEEYLGDLQSLDGFAQALIEWAAACAKIIPMVKPGSVTDIRRLQKARSGDFVPGDAKDVSFLQVEKFADFKVVSETKDAVERRMEQAFMLVNGAQRDAERVTAEEVRSVIQELETGLGGVYSILAQELQYPLVVRYIANMQRAKQLPALPDKTVQPQIVTGLDGLGRSSDLQKLDTVFEGLPQTFGPQAVAQYTNIGALMQRRATAAGIDIKGCVKTDDQVQQESEAAQQAEMAKAVAPNAMKAMGDHMSAMRQAAGQGGDNGTPSPAQGNQ